MKRTLENHPKAYYLEMRGETIHLKREALKKKLNSRIM